MTHETSVSGLPEPVAAILIDLRAAASIGRAITVDEVNELEAALRQSGEAVAWQGRGSRDGVVGGWHNTTREEYAYHKANKTPGYEVRELYDAPAPKSNAALVESVAESVACEINSARDSRQQLVSTAEVLVALTAALATHDAEKGGA